MAQNAKKNQPAREQAKVAIALYSENAGWGGSFATAVGGRIIEKYLRGEISEGRKGIETRMLEADLIHKPKS